MKHTPKQIEMKLKKLHQEYLDKVEKLANEVMQETIEPYLESKDLSFCVMNGFMQTYDVNGDSVKLPKKLINLLDVCDPEGNSFYYSFRDYNPHNQNFNENDIRKFNKQSKGELVQYVFSPFYR
jgi:hypothetical protein